jgi:hypothetical protein
LPSPLLLFNTVRHLKPVQIANRLRRTVFPLTTVPAAPGGAVLRKRHPVPPARISDGGYDGKSFIFLNQRHAVEGAERWAPVGAGRLWVYNLHYFQYLHGLPSDRAMALMADWTELNRDPAGPGWEPYPIAMRVREWTEWVVGHDDLSPSHFEALSTGIASQTEALARQVEYHLLGNHLLEDAITLCWAGLSFEGTAAEGWLDKGHEILKKQLECQILQDGTHEERSPMYQALLTEALLRLAEVAGCAPDARAQEIRTLSAGAGKAMLASLGHLAHPDGEYALLNDCAMGVAPTLAEMSKRFPGHRSPSARRGEALWHLHDAGYMGWRGEDGSYIVFDAGPIGPDHQPGHGHADTLSFELSNRGRRVVTDTGVYTYDEGSIRSYDRGTAAHNTLQVDELEQTELWAAFRCGRRPRILDTDLEQSEGRPTFSGAYRAPASTFSLFRHGRRLKRVEGQVRFQDDVELSGAHTAILRLHVAPGLILRREGSGWSLVDGGTRVASIEGEGFEWLEGRSAYHPEFGIEVERASLTARLPFRDRARAAWSIILH